MSHVLSSRVSVAFEVSDYVHLRAYISTLACQRSSPTNHTEAGLRALLHFLMEDRNVAARLPANESALKPGDQFDGQVHLVCYSDASHAPLRVTKRRGISGRVLSVFGSVVKTLSRHQQMISLAQAWDVLLDAN